MTTALAGRTRNPGPIPGNVRIGGFGGPAGLAAYLVEHRIDRLIDATHPFAAEISRSARLAAERAGVQRLLLLRPRWQRHPLDRWIEVDSIEAAASLVGRIGRCALLTVGAGTVAAFARAEGVRFIVRLIDPPRAELPLRHYRVVCGRGPFSLQYERQLLRQYGDRCARMQGERRRGHRGETDRGARGRNSGYHGAAPAARTGASGRYDRGGARLARRPRSTARRGEDAMNARSYPPFGCLGRRCGGAMIALLAWRPGAHAEMDLFSAYYNNVARAAAANDAATVARLVAGEGYKANAVDDSGRTGLQIAAANGNLQIAAILIKAGANVNQKDRLGNTALHVATERNQIEMAELLIDVGADLNSDNKNGMTPLMIAARQRQCAFLSRRCSRKARTSARPTSPAATPSAGRRKAAGRRWCSCCSAPPSQR